MEKALRVQHGKEQLVSAAEIKIELHGQNPRDFNLICPLCRQPLFPAAMSSGSQQSPHFRHARNNDRAHECELFANNYGYLTTYQRVPLPMFIRRSRNRNEEYIVEGGFKSLDQQTLDTLEHEGARIKIGQKSYNINAHRFGAGLAIIPFEDISLNCSSLIRLDNSSLSLSSTWGYPEDARNAIVFTRDSDTEQGKRLKLGDTIPFETDLFLLAPEREGDRIRASFANARRAGVAGKRTAFSNLAVYEVSLSREEDHWLQGKRYLEECGFEVDESGSTPELLWPPSLTSDGGLLPLFEGSRCVFTADLSSSPDSSLYVHTNTDTSEHNRTIPLHKVDGTGSGFAILRNAAKLSFVTTRNWVFSSAVLLHPSDLVAEDWLHEPNLNPQLNLDKGRCVLELPYPCEVMSYQKRGGIQIFEIVKDQRSYSFDVDLTNKVKVRRRLGASLDYLTVFEKAFPSEHPANKGSLREADEERSLAPGMPKDIVFAKARRNGETRRQCGADRYRALRRKAGR